MAASYTDVDRLILERWEEVLGLRSAFDDIQGRIEEMFEDVGIRLEKWANSLGYNWETLAKEARYFAWKQTWETKKRNRVIYFTVGGLAPQGYRKSDADHPYLWLLTESLELLKMKEGDRIAFARELRQSLGNQASKWENNETSDSDEPLGRIDTNISELQRVELIANPDKLFDYAKSGMEELFTLSDTIDGVLAKFRPEFGTRSALNQEG